MVLNLCNEQVDLPLKAMGKAYLITDDSLAFGREDIITPVRADTSL